MSRICKIRNWDLNVKTQKARGLPINISLIIYYSYHQLGQNHLVDLTKNFPCVIARVCDGPQGPIGVTYMIEFPKHASVLCFLSYFHSP